MIRNRTNGSGEVIRVRNTGFCYLALDTVGTTLINLPASRQTPTIQPASQSSSQLANQPASQPIIQPASQSSSQPANQPASQPTIQPASQSCSQQAYQPAKANHPACHPAANHPDSQPIIQPSRHTEEGGRQTVRSHDQYSHVICTGWSCDLYWMVM